MQPKHPTIVDCHAFLSTMQEKIRLRQWEHLDQVTSGFSAAMGDLSKLLESEGHPVLQQDLADLSFQQRRVSRMLHHAMLSNRNEQEEVQLGMRHLKQRQTMLKEHQDTY